MAPSNLGYSLREAGHHFRRNLSTVLGAVVTIFLSLFIIGLFVIGSIMLNNMVGSVEDQVTIQAFLSDEADQAAVDALQQKVSGWDNVQSVTYKSKEEALQEYKDTMTNKNAEAAVAALDGMNPVPASLVIRLDDSREVASVADRLVSDPDFRREIAIMRLVGASNGFIRGPFLTEGVLEALIGALLAIGALQALGSLVLPRFEESLSFLTLTVEPAMLLRTYAALIVVGVVIGAFGSFIAMRRYLKV